MTARTGSTAHDPPAFSTRDADATQVDPHRLASPATVPVTLTRRSVVAAIGFSPLLAMLPRARVLAAFAQPGPLRFFDPHQAAVVTEATARLIPGPGDDPAEAGHPGAREAGVVNFIDTFLSAFDDNPPRIWAGGPFSDRPTGHGAPDDLATFITLTPEQDREWRARIADLQGVYRRGIAALDVASGGDFTALTHEQMDAVLTADTPEKFRRVLFEHAIEGTYALPEYGGNRALTGWTEINFKGDVAPVGFTATQTSESDGPDPAPADIPLPYQPAGFRKGAGAGAAATNELEDAVGDLGVFLRTALPGLGRRTRG